MPLNYSPQFSPLLCCLKFDARCLSLKGGEQPKLANNRALLSTDLFHDANYRYMTPQWTLVSSDSAVLQWVCLGARRAESCSGDLPVLVPGVWIYI
jgi:hypothetical protein